MTDHLLDLASAGVSIWLDDLSRERLETGNLATLIRDSHVTGVTTNPSIFAAALADGERYDDQVAEQATAGADVDRTVFELTTTDVSQACDLFTDIFEQTKGVDGRISIEVAPTLADDTDGTVASARELWAAVNKPNALIKIPATQAGYAAIEQCLAEGISVNVTLIFGLDQYAKVMEAYLVGLERALEAGLDISTIHSVASFFVSRVDSEIDSQLAAIGGHEELMGKAGVANARLAFAAFEKVFAGERWEKLAAAGANLQRPLWASTGVKNPDYRDTMYVVDLVTAGTVNTMPEKTMQAVADHGEIVGDQVRDFYADAQSVLDALATAGVSYDAVIDKLLDEGVEKFVVAWQELLETVGGALKAASAQTFQH